MPLRFFFFFETTCPFCQESLAAVDGIAGRITSEFGVELLGVLFDSTSATADYAASHGLSFPVVPFPNERYRSHLRIGAVPLLLVVDPDGEVVWSRVGAIRSPAVGDSLVRAAGLFLTLNKEEPLWQDGPDG